MSTCLCLHVCVYPSISMSHRYIHLWILSKSTKDHAEVGSVIETIMKERIFEGILQLYDYRKKRKYLE